MTSLSVEALVGQLFVVHLAPEGRLGDALWDHRQNHYGGIFLSKKNLRSEEQARRLNQRFRRQDHELPSPLVVADEEGGLVSCMNDITTTAPSAMALGAGGKPEVTKDVYLGLGEKLRALGLNAVFAPVLDVNTEAANPVIGTRSFGSLPEEVVKHGQAAREGLQEAGVACCVKHFPGHGSTTHDSHATLPVVKTSREILMERDVMPFRELLAKEAPPEMVMTAHVAYPALDKSGVPATLSAPIIQGLLRRDLAFAGVVITDAMEMKGITEKYGPEEAALLALGAGVDLLLYALDAKMADLAYRAVLTAVETGKISRERIQESVDRIFRLRHTLQARPWIGDDEAAEMLDFTHEQAFFEAALAGVVVEGDAAVLGKIQAATGTKLLILPRELDEHRPVPVEVAREALGRAGFTLLEVSGVPTSDEVAQVKAQAVGADVVVVGTASRGPMRSENKQLLKAALAGSGIRIGVALLDPQDTAEMKDAACRIQTFGFAVPQLWAMCQKLLG